MCALFEPPGQGDRYVPRGHLKNKTTKKQRNRMSFFAYIQGVYTKGETIKLFAVLSQTDKNRFCTCLLYRVDLCINKSLSDQLRQVRYFIYLAHSKCRQ